MEDCGAITERYAYDITPADMKELMKDVVSETTKQKGKRFSLAKLRRKYKSKIHVWLKPENSDITVDAEFGRIRRITHADGIKDMMWDQGYLDDKPVAVCILPPDDILLDNTGAELDRAGKQRAIDEWWTKKVADMKH